MAVVDDRLVAEASTASGPGISRLLWRGCFEVLSAPTGLDHAVRGVTIWDPAVPGAVAAGDVVLVPVPDLTMPLAERVLAVAVDARAAALVVKSPLDLLGLRRRAERLGVTVLVAAHELAWDDVAVLARALAPADRLARAVGRTAVAGLYELAEAAAFLLDGAVEITDPELRVLAFANLDHPVDELRTRSIMARRAPAEAREWLQASGVWDTLRRGRTPMRVDVPDASPRAVAPIVVRDGVAGYVCLAAGGAPRWQPDLDVLGDVAAAAAAHLVRVPAQGMDEDVLAADLLRGALSGSGALGALGRHLPAGAHWCLTALGVRPRHPGERLRSTSEDDRLLASYARLLRRGSTAAVLDGRIYLLTPHRGAADATALAERASRRAEALLGVELAACVSDPIPAGGDLVAVRRSLEHAVDVLAGQPRGRPVLLAELRPDTILAELGKAVEGNPLLLAGVLDVLRSGSSRDEDYLESLRAYFDAGCDVSNAAKRLQIHRNTLRYRLQRIEALCAVDLSDPAERFLVELHTRLLAVAPRTGR